MLTAIDHRKDFFTMLATGFTAMLNGDSPRDSLTVVRFFSKTQLRNSNSPTAPSGRTSSVHEDCDVVRTDVRHGCFSPLGV